MARRRGSLRFRKSIRLAPGVRLSLGKRSVSASVGTRHARVTASRRGLFGSIGGLLGLGYRRRLDPPADTTNEGNDDER